jgi:hypothetical protein
VLRLRHYLSIMLRAEVLIVLRESSRMEFGLELQHPPFLAVLGALRRQPQWIRPYQSLLVAR